MSDPKVDLYVVECRGREGVTTFFVPAASPDGAIEQAKDSARNLKAQEGDLTDPFREGGLEVRVGNFETPGSPTIIFGDWMPLH